MSRILILLLIALPVFPYGKVGHATVAYIAERNISPATMSRIKPLLGGQTIGQVAIRADAYKRSHRNTAPWHYINIPARENISIADLPRFYGLTDIKRDANVVRQIEIDIQTLKNPQTLKDHQTALWFLIHFMGDFHHPLHVGDNHDRGGNGVRVRFFAPTQQINRGHLTNLHSLWDNLIAVKAAEDPDVLGAARCQKIAQVERQHRKQNKINFVAQTKN